RLPLAAREEPRVLEAADLERVEVPADQSVGAEQSWVRAGDRKLFKAATPRLARRFARELRGAPAEEGGVDAVRALRAQVRWPGGAAGAAAPGHAARVSGVLAGPVRPLRAGGDRRGRPLGR